jgi:hypothetical protein
MDRWIAIGQFQANSKAWALWRQRLTEVESGQLEEIAGVLATNHIMIYHVLLLQETLGE